MSGLTPEGFQAKSLEEIKAEMEADLRTRISVNLNLETTSPLGQAVGVFAGQLRKLWELAQAVYASQYPSSASGFSLREVASLTGTVAEGALPSWVLCTVNVDPGTYAVGTLIAHVTGDPESRFTNSEEVFNGGGAAADVADIRFESEDTGPIRANAGTLTTIAEAVTGWNSVTNPLDAELGSEEEGDAELRLRRETELARRGSTTAAAIRVDLLDLEGVTSCIVLSNDTDVVDANGLPPHSVEALVLGGTDEEVAAVIAQAKAAGIQAYGSTTVTYTDDQGVDTEIGFTRPTSVTVWAIVELEAGSSSYAGDSVVEEALVDYGDTNLAVGSDVVWARLLAVVMGVAGVTDVPSLLLGVTDPPASSANLVVGVRQIALMDTSRITVTSTLV